MQKIELRDFMKWAFAEELAHVATDGGSGGWSMMASFAALGTVVDTSGVSGAGVPELANVHPDALAANEAVMLLAGDDLVLPDGIDLFPDLNDPHGLIADCVQEVRQRRALRLASDLNNNLIAAVIAFAVMGKEPDWSAEQPKFHHVLRGGKPAWFLLAESIDTFGRVYSYETDGYNAKSGRPKRGAYRKFEMSANFSGAVQARIDWYLWSMAMEKIAERLSSGLKQHVIKPYYVFREPWRETRNFQGVAQVLEKAGQ